MAVCLNCAAPNPMKRAFPLRLLCALAAGAAACRAPAQPAGPLERLTDGIVLPVGGNFLKVEIRAENIVRIAYARDRAFFGRSSIAVVPPGPYTPWTIDSGPGNAVTLATASLRVRVDLGTGAVRFLDAAGRPILAEQGGGRALEPAEVQGERTFHVRQQWLGHDDESLYGLGQLQLGVVDLKGLDLDLWQRNTVIVVPFLVSSRGYGLLWDNTSFTRFGDLRAFEAIPASALRDAAGPAGRPHGGQRRPGDRPSPGPRDLGGDRLCLAAGRRRHHGHLRPAPAHPRRGRTHRPGHGRLPVSGVLQRRAQGLARRQAGGRPLAPGLAPRNTTSSRSASRPAPATP